MRSESTQMKQIAWSILLLSPLVGLAQSDGKGVLPDANTLGSAIDALNAQTDINHGQGNFLAQLAESAVNQIQVDLVGLAATGLIAA